MLSHLLLYRDHAETSIPLDAFARAMDIKAKERKGARMGDEDCRAFLVLSAELGTTTLHVQDDGGAREAREATMAPGKRGRDAIFWLPVHAIVRVKPEHGEGWAIGITRNGTLRWAAGFDAEVSCEPEPASADDPAGAANVLRWLAEGEVGQSSKAMAHRLVGVPTEVDEPCAHPLDIGDFARCLAFLEAVPEAAKRVAEMADVSPAWAELAKDWEGIRVLYKGEQAAGLSHRESNEAVKVALERAERTASRPKP